MEKEEIIPDNLIDVELLPSPHETHEFDRDQSGLIGGLICISALRVSYICRCRAFQSSSVGNLNNLNVGIRCRLRYD